MKAGEGVVALRSFAKTTHFLVEDDAVWAFAGERRGTDLEDPGGGGGGAGSPGGPRPPPPLPPEAIVGVRAGDSGRLRVRLAGGAELEVSRGAAPGLKARLGLA